MLVTTCRHCRSRFRVTPEQLNLRQGEVRCGQCHEVFNGFEALERFPGDDTGARLLAARAGERAASSPSTPDALADLASSDFGKRVPPAAAAPSPLPAASPLPVGLPDIPDIPDSADIPDLSLAAQEPAPLPAGEAVAPPAKPVEAAGAIGAADSPLPAWRPEDMAAGPFAAAPPVRPPRAWAFAAFLLALLLALQLAYAFRAAIAQQYPVLRPYLESACARAGCTVPWMNDEASLKLEDSELLEVPGKPGQIALQARVRNLSAFPQEFPHLELTLTDVTGQTAVRRVLRPADYLGRVPVTGDVMAGGSEALLSVRLETGRIRPTGYELLLFYP